MNPDMVSLLNQHQAATLARSADAHVAQMARQAIIADRKFDEVDVEQAVANRYSTTGQPNAATG